MRISVSNGDRSVDIYIKGHRAKQLRKAEATAQRLLTAAPGQPSARPAFGYTAASDHTPSPQEDDDDDTDRTAAG